MYTAQLVIKRIQSIIKEKGDTQKNVLLKCGINENTLKRMTDNKGISSFYLAKIADYLGCSVDYLLGRTDIPDINVGNTIKTGDIQAGDNSNNNSSININGNLMPDFMAMFADLSASDKIEAMYFVKKLKEKD